MIHDICLHAGHGAPNALLAASISDYVQSVASIESANAMTFTICDATIENTAVNYMIEKL